MKAIRRKHAFYSFLLSLFLLACLAELYSLFPPSRVNSKKGSRFAYREGVIHVHSTYSNGAGSLVDIGRAASEVGLDFVIVTDHDTLKGRRLEGEKSYGQADLFIESEITTPAGHLLCFLPPRETNLPSDGALKDRCWKHYLGAETTPEMFTITAHPNHPRFPWTKLETFAQGTEALNLDVLWRAHWEDSVLSSLFTAAIYPFQNYVGVLRMLDFPEKDRKSWDTMNTLSTGRFGIFAQDAHAVVKLHDRFSLHWPSYRETFLMGTNVVFGEETSPDILTRKKSLYDGLRQGKSAMLFRAVGDFAGNDWTVECGAEKGRSGSRLHFAGSGCNATVEIPSDFPFDTVLRLYRNGDLVTEKTDATRSVSFPLDKPGTYRVEVWSRSRTRLGIFLSGTVPYVIYNPIYVL